MAEWMMEVGVDVRRPGDAPGGTVAEGDPTPAESLDCAVCSDVSPHPTHNVVDSSTVANHVTQFHVG